MGQHSTVTITAQGVEKSTYGHGIYWYGTVEQLKAAGFDVPADRKKWATTRMFGREMKMRTQRYQGGKAQVYMDAKTIWSLDGLSGFRAFMARVTEPVELDAC